MNARFFLSVIVLLGLANAALAQKNPKPLPGDAALAAYFESETARLEERCLTEIKSRQDLERKRGEYRAQLFDMLGLNPLPEKTDLQPVITGKVEQDDFVVEKIQFQSRPHLYVTANFYLPQKVTAPLPTILYVCGHAKVVTNGVSMGNKTAYQHHGEWFARNGYACLIVDTLQLGEIEGSHRGTHTENQFWWNSRGYTPAGVEAWNNIRALDYLETRPEVDKTRIGVTGRSGGGAYSWVLAALDDRIKVAAPVAGITDLRNYVVDGCVEGHCDCMFFVNTFRWDYPMLAALTAPRPLMLGNSDKDRIFPLDGVERLHAKVKKIYELCDATNNFALLITEGPHADTQDLQLPVFRWFNRKLKGEDPVIEMAAKKLLAPKSLQVFESIPADEINTKIQEQFVPVASSEIPPRPSSEWNKKRDEWMSGLREKVFAGWPEGVASVEPKRAFLAEKNGLNFSAYDFESQPGVVLRIYALSSAKIKNPKTTNLRILDENEWQALISNLGGTFGKELQQEAPIASKVKQSRGESWLERAKNEDASFLFVAPRGIGLTAWSGNDNKQNQIRRRFMLLGQTLDGMRVWDIRRGIQVAQKIQGRKPALKISAADFMAANALYASLFENGITSLELKDLPKSHMNGPDYLNVLRVMDLSQTLELARERCEVRQN